MRPTPGPEKFTSLQTPLVFRHPFVLLALSLSALPARSAAPAAWAPIDPAQLSADAPRLDPDAPAEVLSWKITIDDRDLADPFSHERRIREYVRYKIFDPEKAVAVTRVAATSLAVDGEELQGDVSLRARLTLPNGTSREFGDESVRERPVLHTGAEQTWTQRLLGGEGVEATEKFLAVSGIEPGSILEFQLAHAERHLALTGRFLLQRSIPVRQVELTQLICPDNDVFTFRPFALNRGTAQIAVDAKKHVLTLAAHDLPALVPEPFTGSVSNYALTYFFAYKARNSTFVSHHATSGDVQVDAKAGPWASFATERWLFENDLAGPTPRVRKIADQLSAGATSDLQKARRVHHFVEDLHQKFLRTARKSALQATGDPPLSSIDQVLDFADNPDVQIVPDDFQWLAVALYRATGLPVQSVLLPNRAAVRFDRRLVSGMFLPALGLRVQADGQWHFDQPISNIRLPFGQLPWQQEGQVALLVQKNKQEFVDVPLTPSDQSVISNSGDFVLDDLGHLTGECRRSYTGQSAEVVRALFRRANAQREQGILRRQLLAEFKPANIRIHQITGADDDEAPLTITYAFDYPDFAVLTRDRIIFRPSVFHASSAAPFSADLRHYNLEFPYQWQEQDTVALQLPAGYSLEAKNAPPSYPGPILSYRVQLGLEPVKNVLQLQRDFRSTILAAPRSAYPALKGWYDRVAASDQHELVLVRAPAGAAPLR
jgi:hypothetical protein